MRFSTLALCLALLAPTAAQAVPIHATLPSYTAKADVKAARESDGRIEKLRQKILKQAKTGELDQPSAKKQKLEAKLAGMAKEINQALKGSKDDRPILIIVEGPDGAGKSSTMARLTPAFAGIKQVDEMHFGAPPKDAEKIHWVKRFMDALPEKGGVKLWDRSYYGRAVYDRHYGFAGKSLTKETLREIRDFEGLLRDKVRVVKFYLDTPGENLAHTIAKREVTAPEKLTESDYSSYRDRKQIKALFNTAIEETGREIKWHVIDMKDRGAGRTEMLKILKQELVD